MSDVERIAREVYLEFAASQQHVVVENPVCQVCDKHPSVQINRWGSIKACCPECLDEELRRFEAFHQEQCQIEEEWLRDY